jgi:myo-inositol 2-dehydrogenase/D-chiro-inositol 1-dehydrogenase
MDEVRVGFIGCGTHASMNLYPSLRFTPARLVAAADLHAERRERIARVYNVERVYDDYGKLLEAERDLDAVLVSGPPALHHAAAVAAMERGLHVFCEKPPSEDLAQAEEMLAVSERTGRICMVGFMKRFAQKYAMAKEISEREEFGRPSHLLLRYSFKTGGQRRGFLAGMGSHPFDLARHFMGDYVRVHALWSGAGGGLTLTLSAEFAAGGTGVIVMTSLAPAVVERLELTGEGAMIVVDDVATLEYYPRVETVWQPAVKEVRRPNMALQTPENSGLFLQGYAGEVGAFIEAVRTGTPPPCATIADGVEMMRIVELLSDGESGVFEVRPA